MGSSLELGAEKADLATLLAFFMCCQRLSGWRVALWSLRQQRLWQGSSMCCSYLQSGVKERGWGRGARFSPACVSSPSLAPLPPAPSTALLKSPERACAENELWMSCSADSPPRAAFYPDALEDRAIIRDMLAEVCCCSPGFKIKCVWGNVKLSWPMRSQHRRDAGGAE